MLNHAFKQKDLQQMLDDLYTIYINLLNDSKKENSVNRVHHRLISELLLMIKPVYKKYVENNFAKVEKSNMIKLLTIMALVDFILARLGELEQ